MNNIKSTIVIGAALLVVLLAGCSAPGGEGGGANVVDSDPAGSETLESPEDAAADTSTTTEAVTD